MLDPEAITALLFDHIIAKAEQSLAAATLASDPFGNVVFDELMAQVAELYDRRRIALEEMMLLPFRPLRG